MVATLQGLLVLLLRASPSTYVTAWHVPTKTSTFSSTAAQEAASKGLADRRSFLVQAPFVTIATSSSIISTLTGAVKPAFAVDVDGAKAQWNSAVNTIDNLLGNWDTFAKGGGDAIRTELGTQGITSPLFQIDKALKVLRDNVDDLVEFTEQSEEFGLALSRADSMAYSANFAGGSGKPTPPAVYIEKSKKEVIDLQRIAKSISSLL